MKVLIVHIHPFVSEKIAEALAGIGIVGVTVSQSKEYERGIPEDERVQIEVITHDERIDDAIDLIKQITRQYNVSDADIIVKNMDDTIRIRDGKHGEDTL